MLQLLRIMFTPFGRAGRIVYLAGLGALWLVLPAIGQLQFYFMRHVLGLEGMALVTHAFPSFSMILMGWVLFCLFANRLHDLGRTAIWAVVPAFLPTVVIGAMGGFSRTAFGWGQILTIFVGPLLYFGFAILLLLFKGNETPNRFGVRSVIA